MKVYKPRHIRVNNRKQVLKLVRPMESFFITDVSKRLGMSFVTASKICNELLGKKLILSAGKGDSTFDGGKKPVRYKFNPSSGFVLCGHLRADGLECAVADMTGRLVAESSVPLSPDETGKTLCAKMLKCYKSLLVNMSLTGKNIVAFAIGVNGVVDPVNHMIKVSPHFKNILDADIRRLVVDAIAPDAELFLENKIRFQVQYEADSGVAKGYRDIAVVSAADGVMAGIMLDGKVISGANNIAGEIGHTIVDGSSKVKCHCGGAGCVETQLSQNALTAMIKAEKIDYVHSVVEVFRQATEPNPKVERIISRVTRSLALCISNLIMHVDPQIIVVQGIYSEAGKSFYDDLIRQVRQMCVTGYADRKVNIVPSRFGDKIGLLSAAHYAVMRYIDAEE